MLLWLQFFSNNCQNLPAAANLVGEIDNEAAKSRIVLGE